jgi:hypothetical protein
MTGSGFLHRADAQHDTAAAGVAEIVGIPPVVVFSLKAATYERIVAAPKTGLRDPGLRSVQSLG